MPAGLYIVLQIASIVITKRLLITKALVLETMTVKSFFAPLDSVRISARSPVSIKEKNIKVFCRASPVKEKTLSIDEGHCRQIVREK